MKILSLLLLLFVACGPRIDLVWPVSPDIAQASSFPWRDGTAFVVDPHHALTSASLCDATGDVEGSLCLLTSPTPYAAYPLIIADVTPHGWRKMIHTTGLVGAPVVATWRDQDPWGDPLNTRSGVVGLVLGPHKYAGLAEIKSFLNRHKVAWHDEPHLPGPYHYAEDQMYQR